MHSNEYHGTRVEYQRHKKPRAGGGENPYVTNIAVHHRPDVYVKPADSYEDLTSEANEIMLSTSTSNKDFPKSA